jgi:hypothetical protein
VVERRYLLVLFCASLALVTLAVSLLLLSYDAELSEPQPVLAYGSTTRYVAPGGDCGSVSPCYATIQAAVDAADPDDVVKVAAGNYTDIHVRNSLTQVVYISKTVTIRGGYTTTNGFVDPPDLDANPTTLDAQGDGRVVAISGAGPTIEGLIIAGGGGHYSGGGVYVESASPIIRNNRIVGNSADGDGGAIFVNGGSAQILNNQIVGNTGTWAGGLRIINDADATIVGNEIMSNVAQNSGGGIDLACCGGTIPLVAQNIIVNNDGGAHGGGIRVNTTHALLVNNILAGNQADGGTDIWLDGMVGYPVSTTLLHNTLAGGPAGGEAVWVGTHVTATLVNNIIVSYTMGITNTAPTSSTVTADYTLFDSNVIDYGGGVSSAHEVGGNPLFVDPDGGDYHIGPGSPAIDRGTDAGVTTDLDGDRRPLGPLPDLGADEARLWVFLPLVLRNF